MLSERITTVFGLLGCTNSDIARCVGCSPSNISRIRGNKRNYAPSDRPIAVLADGIYNFADKENNLPALMRLCKVTGESRDALIPALVAWLFDTDEKSLPEIQISTPKKKRETKNRSFGQRLDAVMNLLELSNARLARQISIDDSYISRFRNGVRFPQPGSEIAEQLASALLGRAVTHNRTAELSRITSLPATLLSDFENGKERFSVWLYETDCENKTSAIDRLLECIDTFSQNPGIELPEIKSFATEAVLKANRNIYFGKDGLREAVVRFLGNAAENGGELILYSDEDMDWMVGDRDYFLKWYALMFACVRRGVKIRIVHNVDRGTDEMISAIRSWLPLYMSGMIEPFVCHRGRDVRFSHTVFLRPDGECIYASHINGSEVDGWYEYITDRERLSIISAECNKLFSQSQPLIEVHIGTGERIISDTDSTGNLSALLSTLSVGTLPEKLLDDILMRNGIAESRANEIRIFCCKQRELLTSALDSGCVYEMLPLPSDEKLFGGKVRLNIAPSLCDDELFYTPEEFTVHISAVEKLIADNPSYHLYTLPELPFPGIQIVRSGSLATVIRSEKPYAAFVFTEPMLLRAFDGYLSGLRSIYKDDRSEVRQSLRRFL